jgi:cation transport ATPase
VPATEVRVSQLAFIHDGTADATATHLAGGELAMYVPVDGRFAGSIVASDRCATTPVRPSPTLHASVCGRVSCSPRDAPATTQHVAGQVGIVHVRADCLPSDKVDAVQALTRRPVIMVGDGVYDAPVLAVADVGIAMGARGSTAASESADVVILLDDISRTVRAAPAAAETREKTDRPEHPAVDRPV